jgi:hypothetical protein
MRRVLVVVFVVALAVPAKASEAEPQVVDPSALQ